jgi:hypothetical protein
VITRDLKEVYEAVRSVLLMARRELGLPIDEAEYSVLLTQSTDSAFIQYEDLIEEIRTEMAKKLK